METVVSSCKQLERKLCPILIELVETTSECAASIGGEDQLLSDDQGIDSSSSLSSSGSSSSDSREDLVSAVSFESTEQDQDSWYEEGEDDDELQQQIGSLLCGENQDLLIQHIVSRIMALDLRKNTDPVQNESDNEVECKSDVSDDDNTAAVALDLSRPSTSRLPPAPPLIPIANMMPQHQLAIQQQQQQQPPKPPNPLKELAPLEKSYLIQAYDALVRYLRLGPSFGRVHSPELFQITALKRLQSYLFLYMSHLKKDCHGLDIFKKTFSDNKSIRDFFRLFAGASNQLQRSSGSAFTSVSRNSVISSTGNASVVRSARFDGPLQVVCRGPGSDRHNRAIGLNNTAPYHLRRSDSAGSNCNNHSSSRSAAFHPAVTHSYSNLAPNTASYYNTPPINHGISAAQQLPFAWQPNIAQHPTRMLPTRQVQPPIDQANSGLPMNVTTGAPLHSESEINQVDLEELDQVMEIVARTLPPFVPGVSQEDFDELYGTSFNRATADWSDYMAMTPSSAASTSSNQTSLYASGHSSYSDSIPNSPASLSDFGGSPQPYNGISNPYFNSAMINSPPSLNSPSPGSVETKMNNMSLAVPIVACGSPNPPNSNQRIPIPSGPPPLIPVDRIVEKPNQKPVNTSAPEVAPATCAVTVTAAAAAAAAAAVVLPSADRQSVSAPAPTPPAVVRNQRPASYTTAREEIMATMNQTTKEQSMRQVAKSPMEALIAADRDGDTPLMVACANPAYKVEDLYALIERLKSHAEPAKVFCATNKKRETALYLAALELRPLVAGYVAETMSSLGLSLNQTFQKGDSLIHNVVTWGDEYNQVLRYLLRVKMPDGRPAFDINARNHTGRTALHEAATLHFPNDQIGDGVIKNIQLLLDYKADAGLSDNTSGKTPVHIAIEKRDSSLLELLVSKSPGSADAPMYNDNRPLHVAATLSGVTEAQQLEIVTILLKYGANKARRNKANKLPIELVPHDRDQVKAVLQARARPIYI